MASVHFWRLQCLVLVLFLATLMTSFAQFPPCSKVNYLDRYPGYCFKFLACATFGYVAMDCPANLAFNVLKQACDYRFFVPGCEDAVPDDVCQVNRCVRGWCVPNRATPRGYDCQCHEGFTGPDCSMAVTAYTDPHCIGGRGGIVHLFEWKWNDIAAECERFLGPYGYCAVQTSPANENKIVTDPNRPWWERYQPVSYKIQTRSGSEDEFRNMVQKCNAAGVRIYVDVVINHMTGSGGRGQGTAGTYYDADGLQFPGVPFGPADFNDASQCHTSDLGIHNYSNSEEVRNCRLVGLLDLQTDKEYVRGKLAEYLNRLIDMGVAGFRVDAAKHMWPADLVAIFYKVKDLPSGGRPFVFQEVVDHGGEPIKAEEYFATGRVTNFKFGHEIANVFRRKNPMKYLVNWGTGWGMWASDMVVNFIDNHDNQRGDGGVLTHWEPRPYKVATAFMLAHPYGMPSIMSSYEYNRTNSWEGPPHNRDMSTASVQLSNMACINGWSCEHRWRQIYNMVAFRNIVSGTSLNNWWSGADYQIAFSRGNKGFIALNLEGFDINTNLQTGLPSGIYCDVISGDLENDICLGKSVQVNQDGTARIQVCSNCDNPVLAIHIGAKVGSPTRRY